ncbi:cytochrome P450 307a1 [Diachasma alloeum]|uniref:cytochrome P450 307a1 n=1 Tax=Diachasma alloeum TaxID=454923 RepID=UPI000738307F|nr:cytochrome P450 307a1 [Diachasma alloeum]
MMPAVFLSTTTYFLITASLVALLMLLIDHGRARRKRTVSGIIEEGILGEIKRDEVPEAPGPKPWPIIGSLDVLGRHDVPYKAFGELAKQYNSQIIKLRLGSLNCIVVNGLENIREILYTKGTHFDSRPNFTRYNQLFGGDKDNSLAFSNWSDLQKSRREMLRVHAFPRALTAKYNQLNSLIAKELECLLGHIDTEASASVKVAVKPAILKTCANIFTNYFTSRRFSNDDEEFQGMVEAFDNVFWEVNQGYAADFMPFLMPLHARNLRRAAQWAQTIRKFVVTRLIEDRRSSWSQVIPEKDYVDCLINHVQTNAEPMMSWNTALFALEDILGGHAAIGNFVVKILGYLAPRRHVQETAQKEIDSVEGVGNVVGLEYRRSMPYTEAILLESIRLIASPIVPHVANRDSSVAGYKVEKDAFIFLNNYDLNMSEDLWMSPQEFIPERFIKKGRISKPEYFLPFGGGRRSCMGYKMVQYVSFSIVATILKHYTLLPVEGESYSVPVGSLALPLKTFNFRFEKR